MCGSGDACSEKIVGGEDGIDASCEPVFLDACLAGDLVEGHEDLVDGVVAELTVISLGSSSDVGEQAWFVEYRVVPQLRAVGDAVAKVDERSYLAWQGGGRDVH